MATMRNNIMAILECYFVGYKDEVMESAADRILYQIEIQPADELYSNGVKYVREEKQNA